MLTFIYSLKKVWETDFPKRYRETNNNYLKSYDPKQKLKYIIYINANNLYGYTMSKFLPRSGLNKYTSNSSKDSLLEVDPEYPKELRESHNDYFVALDKIEMKIEMMSSY